MSTVDEVKQRLDIVEIIGEAVPLQKAGRNFRARCPFHTERTPSFYVFPDRQTWHCFGACSTGGDIITFVMRKEGLAFAQALRSLAERAGVPLDQGFDPQQESHRDRLRQANEAAALFFHNALLQSQAAASARRYLQERGVGEGAVRDFQLGYAPNGWDALRRYLLDRSFHDDELVAAGLIVPGERGLHDRFRHRLIFPVRDEQGRVVGFGGRALPSPEGEAQPKYLNTAQTPLFDKGSLLYALDKAKDEIRRQGLAVIVEGYMDVIAAHEHGFTNVVASMGTALTDRQVRVLKRYTRNLALALDADLAGSEATLRGVQMMTEALDRVIVPVPTWRGLIQQQETLNADIQVIALPPGHDPDEVIRASSETWSRLVREAKPLVDYMFQAVSERSDLSQPHGRSEAVAALLPVVAAISDPVIQAHYLQRLARLGQTSEKALQDRLPRQNRRGEQAASVPAAPATGVPQEEFLLALLLRYPELRAYASEVQADLLTLAENRQLFEAWQQAADLEALEALLAGPLSEHYQRLLAKRLPPFPPETVRQVLTDCLVGLKRRTLKEEKYAHEQFIAEQEQVLGAAPIAEAARTVWGSGQAPDHGVGNDAIGAAALFVIDMEIGRQLHGKEPDRPSEQPREASLEGQGEYDEGVREQRGGKGKG